MAVHDARTPVTRPAIGRHGSGLPLLWRVFIANGAVFAFAVVLLSVTPIEITAPIATLEQISLLIGGLFVILAIDFALLRRILSPLRRLTELMQTIDPDRPGRRLDDGVPPREPEVAALAQAFNEMLDRLEAERRESARLALAAQERERLRVARELHDEIGQSLTAVTLKAERAAADAGVDSVAELRRIADEIRDALDDVRRIARELRPEALDDLGLVNALITLCERVSAQTDLRVERDFQRGIPRLDDQTELVIYRIAQESLTNVVRHAGARRATVSLRAEDGTVVLRVTDDGRGMPDGVPAGTVGISGMRERALLAGGTLQITSEPGAGTEVRLTIPVEKED